MAVVESGGDRRENLASFWTGRPWGLYASLLGLVTSAVFTFLVYPRIAASTGALLDPDGYGALGWGLWKFQTFSYYPSEIPSENRGPLYPMIVAGLLHASGGWWPYIIQLFQCLCFSLTCLLTFEMASTLWSRRVGAVASMCCAVHPFLIWYTSRIWIEALTILLFTLIAAATVYLQRKPSMGRAAMLGTVIGAACLAKGTFLPFIMFVPVSLWLIKPRKILPLASACIVIVSALVIVPWTIRNWRLTNTFIPVHGHMGFNFHIGDSLAAHYWESPLAFTPLWDQATSEAAALAGPELSKNFDGWKAEIAVNEILMDDSIRHYVSDPMFLVRKMTLNVLAFWAWSDTNTKTIALAIMQLPLLAVFCAAIARIVKQAGWRSVQIAPAALGLLFYASHLPVLAIGRYSAVLVPVMLGYAASLWFDEPRSLAT